MWIKICGTTSLEDAKVAVDAGADAAQLGNVRERHEQIRREQLVLQVGHEVRAAGDHHRGGTGFDELVQADRRSGGVAQREGLERVAFRDNLGGDALVEHVLDAAVEHLDHVGR